MLMLTSTGFNAFIPPTGPGQFSNMNGWVGAEFVRPLPGPGKPYTVKTDGPTDTDPNIYFRINCTILAFNAENPGTWNAAVYARFLSYIKTNIEAIWSSATNAFMSQAYVVTTVVNIVPTLVNRGTLEDGELFLAIKRGESRSFIDRDRWAGVFYVNDRLNTDLQNSVSFSNLTANVPAHEFGHVLGLTDRYAYIAYVLWPANKKEVIPDRGHTVPLYVDDDPEYGEKYGWLYNLMSNQQGPAAGKAWDENDTLRNNSVRVAKTKRYKEIFKAHSEYKYSDVYITKKQLDIIKKKEIESILGSGLIYIKKIDGGKYKGTPGNKYQEEYVFKGTFVGLMPRADGTAAYVVEDDHYDISRNRSSGTSSNPMDDKLDVDASMKHRFLLIPVNWNEKSPLFRRSARDFLDAALDIGRLATHFMEETRIGGVDIPTDFHNLMRVEYLDHRVAIRAFIGDYIQSRVDESGKFNVTLPGTPGTSRTISLGQIYQIKKLDIPQGTIGSSPGQYFTPPTDLFADKDNLYPFAASPSVDLPDPDLHGLFIPYDYTHSVSPGTRPGRTYFGTPAQLVGVQGAKIPIADPFALAVAGGAAPAGSFGGWIHGSAQADIADVRTVWDEWWQMPLALRDHPKQDWPAPHGVEPAWTYHIDYFMDYWALARLNRRRLIFLVKNATLRADKSRLDPRELKLSMGFRMTPIALGGTSAGSVPGNANPTGVYLALRYSIPRIAWS